MKSTGKVGWMQGSKHFEARLFYNVSLDKLVPQEHLVRQLAKVLDFGWVRAETAEMYSHTGRPSIDPVVICKLLLLGYLYNIRSERQLMREAQVNLAYRWYLGYDLDEDLPDHSILSKSRRRLGMSLFEKLFSFILQCCQDAGLVRGENVLVDSTIVEADASLDSIRKLHYRPDEYWQQLEQVAEKDCASDEHDPPLGQRRPRATRVCDTSYSATDPDASLHRRPGKQTCMAYKTHFMADAHKGVVTAVTASSSAVDDTSPIPQLVEQHERQCGPMRRIVGDHLYGSEDCLGYLQERSVETVIRPRQGGNRHGGLDKKVFTYDPQTDTYDCPGGKTLRRRRTHRQQRKAIYSCDAGQCTSCPYRTECVASPRADAVRHVTRFDSPYVERAEASCASGHGRRLLKQRQTCMEGLFGEGKNWHGLNRARLRGLAKMRMQALLTAQC